MTSVWHCELAYLPDIWVTPDDGIADAGDGIIWNEGFAGTTYTVKHDDAGNLIDDCELVYIYDAWNRLVKVRASNDAAVTIQTAEFDATGRRIKKVVTKSGGFDDTVVYFYDGQKICETRNGSGNMVQQFIHGTQYIDELVMVRVAKKGDLYVHQDANWNVIGVTDLAGSVVERHKYTPYGIMQVDQETGFGDRDGDGDVDATDKGTPGTDCTGTVTGACRVLDLDFDGDYDSADATLFDALPQGEMLHPGRLATNVDQPFGHQGLLFEPEIGSYQNRARQYDPAKRRFVQRDPPALENRARVGVHDMLNVYSYVHNHPSISTDPSGRGPCGPFTWMYLRGHGCSPCTDCKKWKTDELGPGGSPPPFINGPTKMTCCPKDIGSDLDNFDPGKWEDNGSEGLHPGAAKCLREEKTNCATDKRGQQCCYADGGALLTSGAGAGTPDKSSPKCSPKKDHACLDLQPFCDCSLADYLAARPPDPGCP